jgi:hypothetical protein
MWGGHPVLWNQLVLQLTLIDDLGSLHPPLPLFWLLQPIRSEPLRCLTVSDENRKKLLLCFVFLSRGFRHTDDNIINSLTIAIAKDKTMKLFRIIRDTCTPKIKTST